MGARKLITREQVLDEALLYLNETGLAGFSLRALADRLGIASPSLQWHIGTRERLMVDLVNKVLEGIAIPAQDDLDPRDWLRLAALAIQGHLTARPNLVPLVREFAPHSPAIIEIEYDIGVALLRAGLRGRALEAAHSAFITFVFGHVYLRSALVAAAAQATPEMRAEMKQRQQETARRYPEVVDAWSPAGARTDQDQLFTDGLDSLLWGLLHGPAPETPSTRRRRKTATRS
jgi:AcrR family transcriptional regulator